MRWYALAVAVLALDHATKWLALCELQPGLSVDVLPFLSWTLTCNTGAAFSMFQGFGWVFGIAAVLVSGYLVVAIWRLERSKHDGVVQGVWLEGVSHALILAGALGNLADRLIRGCVVDFVHVHYGWFNFPVFNVADSVITVGALGWIVLLAVDMVTRRKEDRRDGEVAGGSAADRDRR